MPTETDIANIAIRKVGEARIASFTDGTKAANIMLDIYDETLDGLLRYPWNFATKRAKLAQISIAPVFGYDHAYALPSDWIYTVSVHGDDSGLHTIDYREEITNNQNSILTNWDEVWLVYTSRVTDPNRMPVDFRLALASLLARELSYGLAQSASMREQFAAEARLTIAAAKSADSINSFPTSRPRGSWANARAGWRRS